MSRTSAVMHLRLYVAGEAPNSAAALANLRSLVGARLNGQHRLEVVDVLADPDRALEDGVLLTPTLVRVAPLPGRRVVGDLSDTPALLRALGLEVG